MATVRKKADAGSAQAESFGVAQVSDIPRYYKCGSPQATFENQFIFSTPNCKYHQSLNIKASNLL